MLSAQKLRQTQAALESAATIPKRPVDTGPRFAAAVRNGPRAALRPAPMFPYVCARPVQGLFLGQFGQEHPAAPAPVLGKHQCQCLAPRQAALPIRQRHVDPSPGLAHRRRYPSGSSFGPASGPHMVLVGPRQDLLNGQRRLADMSRDPSVPGQEPGERRSTQSSAAYDQRLGDGHPRIAFRLRDRTTFSLRPGAGSALISVRPIQDLLHRQLGARSRVLDAALSGQQLGKRRTTGQSTQTIAQGHVDPHPGLAEGPGNRTIGVARPVSLAYAMSINPGEYLSLGEMRKPPTVALASMLGQDPSQRLPTMESTKSLAKGLVDIRPFLVNRFPHQAAFHRGPIAGSLTMRIGPTQDQFDRQSGFGHVTQLSTPAGCISRSAPLAADMGQRFASRPVAINALFF